MKPGSSHHKDHLQPHLGLSSLSCFTLELLWLKFQPQVKPCPVHPSTRLFTPAPSAHAESSSSICSSHPQCSSLACEPSWSCWQEETAQEISMLSWLSMNDFEGIHRSYLQETGWKGTACAGKLVPSSLVSCNLQDLHTAEKIQNHICQSLLHKACRKVICSCQGHKGGWDNSAFPIG